MANAKTTKAPKTAAPVITEIDNDLFVEDTDTSDLAKYPIAATYSHSPNADDSDIDPATFDPTSDDDDDGFSFDFAAIDLTKKSFEPLPEGQYEAVIAKAEGGTSKKNDPQIALTWRVLGGEYEDRQLWDYLTFTAAAMWSVVAKLQAIDLVPTPAPTTGIGKIKPRMLLGERATLVVTQVPKWKDGKEVAGEFQNRITKWLPAGSAQTFDDLLN